MNGNTIIGAALSGAALLFFFVSLGQAQGLPWQYPYFRNVESADGQFWSSKFPNLFAVFEAPDGAPAINLYSGELYRLSLDKTGLGIEQTDQIKQKRAPAGALPFGIVAEAGVPGLSAWLDAPTERYSHGVLGDAIEAGAITVRYADGSTKSLVLPDDRVFEDISPRFIGMPGSDRESLLTVTSYLNSGAALTLIDPGSPGDLAPRVIAEAAPIGTPNRWLNPVGAGDVDGDGRVEMLAVITPHIGGTLRSYELEDGRLIPDAELAGFSNHAIGSRELVLSAVVDLDSPADRIPEVVVPDASREVMNVIRFTGRTPKIVARLVLLKGKVAHRLVISDLDGDGEPELTFGTDNDGIVVWKPRL